MSDQTMFNPPIPPMPGLPEKKSMLGLIIVVIAIIILLGGGVAYYFLVYSKDDTNKTLNNIGVINNQNNNNLNIFSLEPTDQNSNFNYININGTATVSDKIGNLNVSLTFSDQDQDKFDDRAEAWFGSSPNSTDTDGDGFDDKTEIENGFNPNGTGVITEELYNNYCLGVLSYNNELSELKLVDIDKISLCAFWYPMASLSISNIEITGLEFEFDGEEELYNNLCTNSIDSLTTDISKVYNTTLTASELRDLMIQTSTILEDSSAEVRYTVEQIKDFSDEKIIEIYNLSSVEDIICPNLYLISTSIKSPDAMYLLL